MKTKTIKKLNLVLLSILLLFLAGAGGFVFFGQSQEKFFKEGIFAGKAQNASGLGDKQEVSEVLAEEIGVGEIVEIIPSEDSVQIDSEPASAEETAETDNPKQQDQEAEKNETAKFSFAVFGDSDSKDHSTGFSAKLDFALGKAKGYLPDFVLFTGDVLRIGKEGGSQSKARIEGLRSLVQQHFNHYYFVFGNHDVECGNECIGLWERTFFGSEESEAKKQYKLYHSFDFQNTHFILLSTEYPERFSLDQDQLKWLEEDLEKNNLENVVVVQHTPPVSFFKDSGKKCQGMSCDEKARQKLFELYKKHGVDLVISGTEEVFDHKVAEGIDFVLSGSIGKDPQYKGVVKGDIYVLCSIKGGEIWVEAINTQGEVIRKIKIK